MASTTTARFLDTHFPELEGDMPGKESLTHRRRTLENLTLMYTAWGDDPEGYVLLLMRLYRTYQKLGYKDSQDKIRKKIEKIIEVIETKKDGNVTTENFFQETKKKLEKDVAEGQGGVKSNWKLAVNFFSNSNSIRLLLTSVLRVFTTALLLSRKLQPVAQAVAPIIKVLGRVTPWLAIVWYVPRFFWNLALGVSHLVSVFIKNDFAYFKKHGLDYFKKHAYEMSNDTPWFIVNILCFIFPPLSLVVILFYAFDVLNGGLSYRDGLSNSHKELNQLLPDKKLTFFKSLFITLEQWEKDYVKEIEGNPEFARKKICAHIYERRVALFKTGYLIGLCVGTAVCLGVALVTTTPLPVVVMAGACLVMLLRIGYKLCADKYFERIKVNTCDNAVHLLCDRLLEYLTDSIKRREKLPKESNVKPDVLGKYENVKNQLSDWRKSKEQDYSQFANFLGNVIEASKQDGQGSKQLKTILAPFKTTDWEHTPLEIREQCKKKIQAAIKKFSGVELAAPPGTKIYCLTTPTREEKGERKDALNNGNERRCAAAHCVIL